MKYVHKRGQIQNEEHETSDKLLMREHSLFLSSHLGQHTMEDYIYSFHQVLTYTIQEPDDNHIWWLSKHLINQWSNQGVPVLNL